jgi:hypothetical protein
MTPEERQLLNDINKKLNDFLVIYYKLNFPNIEIMEKSLQVKDNLIVNKTLTTNLLNFTSLENKQPAITKPTGGTIVDSQARNAINTIIDTLKTLNITE